MYWVSAGKGRDIELRHQRNPDVVFDCLGPLTGGLQAAWHCSLTLSSQAVRAPLHADFDQAVHLYFLLPLHVSDDRLVA